MNTSPPNAGARSHACPGVGTTGWQWRWLLAAPHRLAFASAAAMLATTSLWWAIAMVARSEGSEVPWSVPPFLAHGLLMCFGFMPLFICGFLFTAGPKWLARPPVQARSLLPAVVVQLAGWAVFGAAIHARLAQGSVVAAIGLATVATGWSMVMVSFIRMLRASRVEDRSHARVIALAGVWGAAALWLAAAGLATGQLALVRGTMLAALWGFVGIVFTAVSHRMIPFFCASALPALDAWRPLWLLRSFTAVLAFEAAGAFVDGFTGSASPAWRGVQAVVELPAGLALLALAVRWGLVQSLRIRLLAMLHLGFVWLGIALVLAGASHAMQAASAGDSSLGLAPLHAYTMGFLGSTLLAMVTRVTCGHGGRTLTADDFIWRLFWVLQLAIVVRIAAALVMGSQPLLAPALLASAAIGWAGVCIAWAVRYGRWYGTPRADGRPG